MDLQNAPSTNQFQSYDIKQPVGYALLLGCGEGQSRQVRPSTSVLHDLHMMEDTLKQLGWTVSSPCLDEGGCCEFTAESCEQIVNNLETPELMRRSCFMLYFSGYGTATGIVGSNGRVVPFRDVVTKIGTLNAFVGKPKIFIFDCCRQVSQKELVNLHNQSSSYSREIEDHLRQDGSVEAYPPPDCILCFSACEGYSVGGDQQGRGSYYTTLLCNTLLHVGLVQPFIEILTHVSGGTASVSARVFGQSQQPVFRSTLNKRLVLSPIGSTGMRLPGRRPQVVTQDSPVMALPSPSGQSSLTGSDITSPSDVVCDNVAVTQPRKVFKTKEDVVKNLAKLGEGVSVFVVYAPDPESPYHNPQTRGQEIDANERRIFQLVYDLERHGFHVVTDLHLGDNTPPNWLEWYTARVELCDYVLLVGSPAFCELFAREKPRAEILDRRAKLLLSYKNAVYAEIFTEVSTRPGTSKFVPVLLDPRWPAEDAVPSLLRAATVYQLLEDGQRQFVYDDRYRDFERLVCRMAGINRAEIDKTPVVGVRRLPPPHHGGASVPPALVSLEVLGRRKTGHKVVMPVLVPASTSQVQAGPPPPAPVTSQVHPHYVPPVSHPPRGFMSGPPPPPPMEAEQQWPPGRFAPQPPLYHPQQAGAPSTVVYQTAVGGNHYHGILPTQQQQPLPPASTPPPSSLPDIEPTDRTDIFVWLSKELVGWPFLARFLKVDEATIERIKEENLREVSEQCYQMLEQWYRQRPSKFSYRTLGEALFKSERNRHLYPEYVQKVMAQMQSQDMDTN